MASEEGSMPDVDLRVFYDKAETVAEMADGLVDTDPIELRDLALNLLHDVEALKAVTDILRQQLSDSRALCIGHVDARDLERAEAGCASAMAEVEALKGERDLAVAHDRQPYPTADAYEKACAALEKHRARADTAEAEIEALKGARLLSVLFGHHEGAPKPFALQRRNGQRELVALGAEFPDGAVALRLANDGGWTTMSTGGAAQFGDANTEILWLSDELEPLAAMEAEVDALRQHILDIDAHATPYGDLPDEPGFVGTYLLTAGALHRALGKIGHSAPNCSAEAERNAMRPVVEAAKAWRAMRSGTPTTPKPESAALIAAVDALDGAS